MKPAPALLLGLLAPTAAALHLNRRDALKGTTASCAQIALPTASLAQVALPAVAAGPEKLALPKMGIGAWAWGDSLFWGYDPKEDEELEKVFSFVAARKDGFVDTAELYGIGRSETLVGQFEKRHGKVTVASKFAALPWRTSRDDVVKACEASLKRLGRDSMELYQIHFPNAWANEAYWDGLGDCYDRGLVKAVGVSTTARTRSELSRRRSPRAASRCSQIRSNTLWPTRLRTRMV